jgi:hypothetical protein
MNTHKTTLAFIILMLIGIVSMGQGLPLGETIFISSSPLNKDVNPLVYESYMLTELVPSWNSNSPGASMYLLKADRGDRNGELLTICMASGKEIPEKLGKGSPFADKSVASVAGDLSKPPSNFLKNPDAYTEYQLLGGDRITPLPSVEILGIHYMKVKPEKKKDYEKFVTERLHPTVGNLVHDMNLLYYKAVNEEDKDTFITIYAIESVEARERFWPTGGQEQDIVKELFGPYKDLAKELASYLVEDSYLKPESGGGAAIFESLEWTDFVVID